MRILITGSRDWEDRLAVYRALDGACAEFDLNHKPDQYGNTLPDPRRLTVVHGACPTGADHWADEWCISNWLEPERHPPDFAQHGSPHAFHVRNREMVEAGADVVLAFYERGAKNAGTRRTVELAETAGIPVRKFES